jgi:hypothetical protein
MMMMMMKNINVLDELTAECRLNKKLLQIFMAEHRLKAMHK